MTKLQKEFENTGYTSWINSDIYPDGKIYTQEYTRWLEKELLASRESRQLSAVPSDNEFIRVPYLAGDRLVHEPCGENAAFIKICYKCHMVIKRGIAG